MNTIIPNPPTFLRNATHTLIHINRIKRVRTVAVGALTAAAVAYYCYTADSVNYIVESIRLSLYLSNFISNKPYGIRRSYMQSTPFVTFSLHLICSITYAHGCLNSCICETWKKGSDTVVDYLFFFCICSFVVLLHKPIVCIYSYR